MSSQYRSVDNGSINPVCSASDESARVIVQSTIDLAHNLGLRVIAEGVEDAETWAMLHELGCDQMQGFYASRALPADALRLWLDTRLGTFAAAVA
jgi:EAL domain-containing protein (putative c-di-GMP-specific phosphodiesterase class I)